MAELNTPQPSPSPPPADAPPQEVVPQVEAPTPEATAPAVPVQVGKEVFLAARLRETLAESANLRDLVADLQKENARLRANEAQTEINGLDAEFNVGQGTILQKRPDGTYWRIPKELVQQAQPQG
jgi:hypothetical protein